MKIILGYTITVTTVTTVTIPSTCDTKSDMQIYPFGTITDAPSQTHLRYAHHCHMEY